MKSKQIILLVVIFLTLSSTISIAGVSDNRKENDYKLNTFPPDNFADEIIYDMSFFYMDGENALGAPDGLYAKIFLDYSNGLMVFDLGRYEICVDSAGDDLRVHINNGTYIIKIGNSLSSPFATLGQSNITDEFDINSVGFTEVRYVQIQYVSGAFVELDAIEVINLFTPIDDYNDPLTDNPPDFWIWNNITSTQIIWSVSDATPWNYSIKINGVEELTDVWDENTIVYNLDITSVGTVNVTLTLWDFFGNSAQDTISVEIRPVPTGKTNYSIFAILPLTLVVIVLRRKFRNY